MTESPAEQLHASLQRHTDHHGEVAPHTVAAAAHDLQGHGRFWDVVALLAADFDTLRYVAGGGRPSEIVTTAQLWADSDLTLSEIELVLGAGGYDPDPFATLAEAGLLEQALSYDDGEIRLVDGQRAGAWISDQLSSASVDEVIDRTQAMIADTNRQRTSQRR